MASQTNQIALLNTARMLAQKVHFGQTRNDGTTPYIEHVRSVAARVGDDLDAQVVAWLHDTMESDATKPLTSDKLVDLGFPWPVVRAVAMLTRRAGQSYEEHIMEVVQDPLARKVKIADNLANLSDAPTATQIRKYSVSLLMLTGETKPGH